MNLKTAKIGIIISEQVANLPRRLSRKPGIFLSCVLFSGIVPLERIEIPPDCYLCLSVVFCLDKAVWFGCRESRQNLAASRDSGRGERVLEG